MSAAPFHALVPVKGFERGKSRLAPALDAPERQRLALDLFDRVLRALLATPGFAGVLVCTDSLEVAALASLRRGETLLDTPEVAGQLAKIVDAGLAQLAAGGAARAVVLMGDLPSLTPESLSELTAGLEQHDWVLAPDHHGEATNALALHLDRRLPTCFGQPGSFARHLEVAKRAGLRAAVLRDPVLGLDIDHPEDLTRLESALAPG